jgi:hypothetical protein
MTILRFFMWAWALLISYIALKIPGLIISFIVFMIWLFIKDRFFFWVFFLATIPPVVLGYLFKPIAIAYYVMIPIVAYFYGRKWLRKERKLDADAPDGGGRFYIYAPINTVMYILGFILVYTLSVSFFTIWVEKIADTL